jgi:hypothetical protein
MLPNSNGDLNMHQISANAVPRLLINKQKQQQFLAVKKIAMFPQPRHLSDFTPCDFFLFLEVKLQL